MKLFINATTRKQSRTLELAGYVEKLLGGDFTHIDLGSKTFPKTDEAVLAMRDAGDFSHPYFDMAKQFALADEIIIAAPYWDLSFPAVLKQYIESIMVAGITFRYTQDGPPEGLCRAEKIWYVTTGGGIIDESYGYGYIKSLAENMFGIKSTEIIKAENLDIYGADVRKIMDEAKKNAGEAVNGKKSNS